MTSAAATEPDFRALPSLDVIAIEGVDAAAFLHAQLASDVAALAPSGWQWSSWLSAQGRVLALLLLLRSGPQAFLAMVAHGRGEELAARLRRYVLRAKLELARSPLQCSGRVARVRHPGTPPLAAGGAVRTADGWELALGGSGERRLRLGPRRGMGDGDPAWTLAEIEDGVPWIAPAVADSEIPQTLQLERLGAFSLGKGCYPGQEIVARTHFLGRSKRRLLHFRAAGAVPPVPGDALPAATGTAPATVFAAAIDGPAICGLAVVRGDPPARGQQPGASEPLWRELP